MNQMYTAAYTRGIAFRDLSPPQQATAKQLFIDATGDTDEDEAAWLNYGYHPESLIVLGDDYIYSAESQALCLGRYVKE